MSSVIPVTLAPDFASLSALLDTYPHTAVPCRVTSEPELWTSSDAADQEEAAAQCRTCPALDQCRAYGLKHRKEQGVYGGLTEQQRKEAKP